MSTKRQRRFYEVLRAIKPPEKDDLQPHVREIIMQNGRKNHAIIEEQYPDFKVPHHSIFSSAELEFDVGYHPDLYDEQTKTVYEIKSASYFNEQERYCLVQASGYLHFLQAQNIVFLLYHRLPNGSLVHLPQPARDICPWGELKRIMVDSDQMLLENEV